MFAVFVTVQLKPGFKDQFIELMRDAHRSVADEPGSYRFDVLQDNMDLNRFHLYQVFADHAAREVHRQAPGYLKRLETVNEWLDGDIERTECTTIFPSEDGWRRQKTNLPSHR